MVHLISLHYSDTQPVSPRWRRIERVAHADRLTLGCRFGEPCEPRCLRSLYDVRDIIETPESWEKRCGSEFHTKFGDIPWSGMLLAVGNGDYLVVVNPGHSQSRRTLTIAHEFGHLALGHSPVIVNEPGWNAYHGYSDSQELDAFAYGLALLIPYAPFLQFLEQGATLAAIAHHYCVSVEAVEMRLKLTGLWPTYGGQGHR